jgi:hypothetical protein
MADTPRIPADHDRDHVEPNRRRHMAVTRSTRAVVKPWSVPFLA